MMNPLIDQGRAVKKIADFLEVLKETGSLDLQPHILACNGHVQPNTDTPAGADFLALPGASASDSSPVICVEFTGTDTPLLLARNGELLHAIEHLAAKILRLEPEEHDLIFFDAEGFKANRDRELQHSAATAIEQVRATGRPYSFPPMTSRERRCFTLPWRSRACRQPPRAKGPGALWSSTQRAPWLRNRCRPTTERVLFATASAVADDALVMKSVWRVGWSG